MNVRIMTAAIGLALIIGALGALAGLDSCRKHQGTQAEVTAHIAQGEANAHQQAAQAIPNHLQALEQAKADVDRAQQTVAKLRRQLAAASQSSIPNPPSDDQTPVLPVAPDHRDELLAADAILIEAQAGQIAALTLALTDEQRRSSEWEATAKARERQAMAQAEATKAWGQAVTSSRWIGRAQGFAAGIALGYVGGRR